MLPISRLRVKIPLIVWQHVPRVSWVEESNFHHLLV